LVPSVQIGSPAGFSGYELDRSSMNLMSLILHSYNFVYILYIYIVRIFRLNLGNIYIVKTGEKHVVQYIAVKSYVV
jgi:hypothetical protein